MIQEPTWAKTDLKRTWCVQDAITLFFRDGKKDGDVLSHEWILFALDVQTPQTKDGGLLLLERMDTFRTAMLYEYRIALQNVWGVGYRVVPPHEQAEYAARVLESHLNRGLQKSNQLLKHIRKERLSHIEQKRHTDCEIRIAALSEMVSKEKRNVFRLFMSEVTEIDGEGDGEK